MEFIDIIGSKCINEIANSGQKCVEYLFKYRSSLVNYDGSEFIVCAKYLFTLIGTICPRVFYFIQYSKIAIRMSFINYFRILVEC